ncbi:MAG: RHS repeat-associated core domain-containing protein, partial [Verrucomicrobiaceae bacterium]
RLHKEGGPQRPARSVVFGKEDGRRAAVPLGDDEQLDAFAAYDGHGNRIASIGRNSSRTHDFTDVRGYDAWGQVITGTTTGRPSARYSASVGHRQDDESGLIYMRARYYDAQAGRFISQDPAMEGLNWFSYCSGNPVNRLDHSGKSSFGALEMMYAFFLLFGGRTGYEWQFKNHEFHPVRSLVRSGVEIFVANAVKMGGATLLDLGLANWAVATTLGQRFAAGAIVVMAAVYTMLLIGLLLAMEDAIDKQITA